jgi:hypothetical protein
LLQNHVGTSRNGTDSHNAHPDDPTPTHASFPRL